MLQLSRFMLLVLFMPLNPLMMHSNTVSVSGYIIISTDSVDSVLQDSPLREVRLVEALERSFFILSIRLLLSSILFCCDFITVV